MEAIFKSFFLNVACKEHLIMTIITSRQLNVQVKVNTKVVDDEGNAILTNELQPYLLVPRYVNGCSVCDYDTASKRANPDVCTYTPRPSWPTSSLIGSFSTR